MVYQRLRNTPDLIINKTKIREMQGGDINLIFDPMVVNKSTVLLWATYSSQLLEKKPRSIVQQNERTPFNTSNLGKRYIIETLK